MTGKNVNDMLMENGIEDIQSVVNMLEYFVDGKSDTRGIVTDEIERQDEKKVEIDSASFVHILCGVLKIKHEPFTIGNIMDASELSSTKLTNYLLQFFSSKDIDIESYQSKIEECRGPDRYVQEIMVS